jgi:hypothetical protein
MLGWFAQRPGYRWEGFIYGHMIGDALRRPGACRRPGVGSVGRRPAGRPRGRRAPASRRTCGSSGDSDGLADSDGDPPPARPSGRARCRARAPPRRPVLTTGRGGSGCRPAHLLDRRAHHARAHAQAEAAGPS